MRRDCADGVPVQKRPFDLKVLRGRIPTCLPTCRNSYVSVRITIRDASAPYDRRSTDTYVRPYAPTDSGKSPLKQGDSESTT